MLWVDTWLDGDEARAEEARGIIEAFRPFWESERHKKVRQRGAQWGREGARLGRTAGRQVEGSWSSEC